MKIAWWQFDNYANNVITLQLRKTDLMYKFYAR